MPVHPSDFLRAFVLAVTERLQRGEAVSLPGVGTWSTERDERTGRVVVRFSDGDTVSAQVDPALALAIALELGSAQPEVTARLTGYARAIASHLNETGSVVVPGIGRLSGSAGQRVFRPEPLFVDAVDWDREEAEAPTDETPGDDADTDVPVWHDGPTEVGADDGDTESTDHVVTPEETDPPMEVAPDDAEPDPRGDPSPAAAGEAARSAVRQRTPRRPEGPSPEPRSGLSPALPLVVAALLIVVVTAVVLMLRRPAAESVPGDPNPPAAAIEPQESGESLDVAVLPADSTTTSAPPDDTTTTAPVPEPPAMVEPAPRLALSQDFDVDAAGYTLIVGSTPSETEALASIARYEPLGLPTAVLAYAENGATRYRLAVGRFDTVEEADRTRQSMADRLPDGTWVRRIRP